MQAVEEGRFIMVNKMIGTPVTLKWIPFEIGMGIEVAIEEFFR
jgi:KaiC/GvpD/RAD55 family RecA-like ATPase